MANLCHQLNSPGKKEHQVKNCPVRMACAHVCETVFKNWNQCVSAQFTVGSTSLGGEPGMDKKTSQKSQRE